MRGLILKATKGFTLIELLIVITIIGMLATLVTVSSSGSRAQARDAERRTDLERVGAAIELYRAVNKRYPVVSIGAASWEELRDLLVPTHLTDWPTDPRGSGPYIYTYTTNGSSLGPLGTAYALDARLERTEDPEVMTTIEPSNPNDPSYFLRGVYRDPAGVLHYRVAGR